MVSMCLCCPRLMAESHGVGDHTLASLRPACACNAGKAGIVAPSWLGARGLSGAVGCR